MASNFTATDAAGYELTMGRWSRLLAKSFLSFAPVERGDVQIREVLWDVRLPFGQCLGDLEIVGSIEKRDHVASRPNVPAKNLTTRATYACRSAK